MAIQPDLEWFFSVFKDFLCKKIMKKLKEIIINKNLVSLALLVCVCLSASSKSYRDINVRFSPEFLFGVLNTSVDFKIKRDASLGISTECSAIFYKYCSVSGGVTIKSGGTDILSTGWIINPYLKYAQGSFSNDDNSSEFFNEGLGIIVGHQWFYRGGLNIRFGLGAQYNSAEQFKSRIFPTYNLTIAKSI